MKTKNLTKQEAITQLQYLYKITAFNNELKKAVRKEIKANPDILLVRDPYTNEPRKINGWNDSPSVAMIKFVSNFIKENATRMDEHTASRYWGGAGRIFCDIYSMATNTYLNNDIKDLEKYINMLDENKENLIDETSIKGATITRENGRLNVDFGGRVDSDTYKILRSNGFLYSPKFAQFARQLTPNAERSLKRVIEALA